MHPLEMMDQARKIMRTLHPDIQQILWNIR